MIQEKRFVRGANNNYVSPRERDASLMDPFHPIVAVRSANGTCVCQEHRHVPASDVRTCLMVQEKRFVRGANNDYGSLRERNVCLSRNTDTFLRASYGHARWFRKSVSFAERTTTMVRSANGTCVCQEHRHVPAMPVRTCSMVQEKRFVRGANNDYGW